MVEPQPVTPDQGPSSLLADTRPPCGHCLSMVEADKTGPFRGTGRRGTPKQLLGTAMGRRHARRGDWQQAADSTLGRTTDGSTDGVATEGVACRGGLSEEPHILGNGARGQARTGVKCVGRPTLSWKDHQQKMEG